MPPNRSQAPARGGAGLCGWFGSIDPKGPPAAALARMGQALDGNADPAMSAITEGAALYLGPGSPAADLAAEDGLLAAVDGYPQWTEPDAAARAGAHGNAKALLDAYRRFGPELLGYLHGPFAIAVLDPKRKRALLAIDRMGIHPLCFAPRGGEGVVFGSVTGSVAAHPSMDATVSPQALFDYLFFYRVPAPETIYAEQQKLLPAQYLAVDAGSVATAFYWQVPYQDGDEAEVAELRRSLFEGLRGAVARAVIDEDPRRLGSFLSGGLDSSTLTGLLGDATGAPARAFTVEFDCPGYDETEYARAAARHFRAEHQVYRVSPADVGALIPRIAEAYDEPFGNSSVVPAYYCARLAREHGVEVLLAGDGGDEIFAGNAVYARMKLFELYYRLPASLRRRVIEPLVFGAPGGGWFPPLRKARGYIRRARIPLPDRMFEVELSLVEGAAEILAPEVADVVDPVRPLNIVREAYRRTNAASPLRRMLHLDMQLALADNDLRKVNRMCALAGVRVRYPFLDETVVELAAKVPPEMLIRGLRRRYFYRRAVAGYLPRKILYKRKHGFGLPYGPWLKTVPALQEIAFDSLAKLKRRGYLRDAYIDQVVAAHRESDHHAPAGRIWDLMMLELWLQHHVDRRAIAAAVPQAV
jgi:asparagine synthase (glutamine-hydrolysing)